MRTFVGIVAAFLTAGLALTSARAEAPDGNKEPVVITMLVPADAQITFDGTKTTQTGTVRRFISPPLATSSRFRYQIEVMSGGKGEMEVRRPLVVSGGDQITLDFRGGEVRETRNAGTGRAYFDPDTAPRAPTFYRPVPATNGPRALPLSPDHGPHPYGMGGSVGAG
jgi:uncharacterized protein (TIGR03000 family)